MRSGKTITTLIDWARFIRNGPPGALAMCGRTERTIINNLIIPMQEIFGKQRVKINYGTGVVTIFGRDVSVYGADNEQARTKIQGLTLAGAYVDECSTVPESFFNMLYTRLSVPGAKLWLTANPEGPNHWLKKKWLDRARVWVDGSGAVRVRPDADSLELHRYTFLLDDNVALTAEYVERIKRSYSGIFQRRYVQAQWVAAEGAIYDAWDPDRHVIPWAETPPLRRLLGVGLDYGTTNASSAVLLGLAEDGTLVLVDEWRHDPATAGRRLTDGQVSRELRAWLAQEHVPGQPELEPEWLFVDPAAASLKVQLHQDGERRVTDADNSVAYGIRTTASLLAMGALVVADRCTGVIDEAPSYAWDPKATEKGEDKPLKVADHSLDAARYVITTTETVWRPWVDDWRNRKDHP